MSLAPVKIVTRTDALIWQLVDAIFSGGDARELCRRFEIDLFNLRAREVLERDDAERRERLIEILRDTDPAKRETAIA